MAGRRPKPTHLKVVAGNPGKRPLPENEPQPAKGIPKCPSYMPATAKHAWREVCQLLSDMGVLTLADKMALELLVGAYAEYRKAAQHVYKHGFDSAGRVGGRNAAACQLSDAWKRIRAMLIEFGLTPAARSRISTVKDLDATEQQAAEFFGH